MKRRLILLALVAACASDPLGPRTSSEYVLETIGGAPLPAVLLTDYDVTVSVVSDVITLRDDSTFLEVAVFAGVAADRSLTAVDSVSGTWSVTGSTMYLLLPSAKAARLTIDGSALIQDLGGGRLIVYRRRSLSP